MSCLRLNLVFTFLLFVIYIYLLYEIWQDFKIEEKSFHEAVNNTNNYTSFHVENVEWILDDVRSRVKWELRLYNWSASGVKGLEDLLPEEGGTPFKTLIISPWRSGSTYLGYLFSSLPGVVYYYEPLAHFNSQEKLYERRQNQLIIANLIKDVLKCENFNNSYVKNKYMGNDVKTEKQHFSYHNSRMWWYCKEGHELCDNSEVTEKFCKLFPFQVVKDVHVRLSFVEKMIIDDELNLQIVVLVRDPRATLLSRVMHDEHCNQSHCLNVEPICADMVADHAAARRLLQRYPRRIKVLRFEDLVLKPLDTVVDLLRFLNLHMVDAALEFLMAQLALSKPNSDWVNEGDAFSWKAELEFKQTYKIQDICKEAMDLWGYLPANSWTQQRNDDFLPLTNYDVKD